MRKRAALARAMALKPSVLLVDEPSAGLDPITSEEIDNLLISLGENNDTTLVVVTHNIPSAKRVCDEMILLDEGGIRARGDLAALEASEDEVVQKFLGSQGGG
jgi:phospholipid/cholesterol/gamma-HCH transport system ATP-binding protein